MTARSAFFLAGLIPIVAANLAYWWNIQHGMDVCMPYLEGCTSVSRAVRSGPGLWLIRGLAVPAALCLALAWWRLPPDLRGRWVLRLGLTGAFFLLVYTFALGTDGDIYRWMRRYGVVLYFGCTGLAQLLVARALSRGPRQRALAAVRVYLALVVMTWGIGVVSALKRKLIDDPAMQDRLQNALEWNFALVMCLALIALGAVLRRPS